VTTSPRALGAAGAIGCILALALCAVDARSALAGWLAGFVFFSAIPLGGLALWMMVRLMPGAWRAEAGPPSEMLSLLLPVACIAVLPILIGCHVLYRWTDMTGAEGFRGVYLSVWFFVLRAVVFLAVMLGFGFLMMTRRSWLLPLSAGGIIVFTLFDTTIMTDWLMSLDPDFDSSGFGLYALSIQLSIALMVLVIIRLTVHPVDARPELLGALMIVVLLCWEYFAFMQYFIIWSENLPKRVAWFKDRGTGVWAVAEYAFSLLDLVPTFLLFFAPIRRSRRWVLGLASAVLLAKAIEIVWIVFPSVDAAPAVGLAAAILALLGLLGLSRAFFAWMSSTRPAPQAGR
jgi:hypothetical protein